MIRQLRRDETMDFNLNELSFENIGVWPKGIKVLFIGVSVIVILFLGYWLDNSGQIDELHKVQSEEIKLIDTLKVKQHQATNFEFYSQQLIQINQFFKDILQRLPTKSEVPGLLEDISKTGIANGLEFKLFKPLPEVQGIFYAELPIEIAVIGNYHQIAGFISEVASRERIVTFHDFSISAVKADTNLQNKEDKLITPAPNTELLELQVTAKTYRYTGDQANHSKDQKSSQAFASIPTGVKNKHEHE